MTLRTISSVEAFLCLQGSMPIATLALWIVFPASLAGCSTTWRLFQVVSPMFLVCEEEVSNLSASSISSTASRSARRVGSQRAKG